MRNRGGQGPTSGIRVFKKINLMLLTQSRRPGLPARAAQASHAPGPRGSVLKSRAGAGPQRPRVSSKLPGDSARRLRVHEPRTLGLAGSGRRATARGLGGEEAGGGGPGSPVEVLSLVEVFREGLRPALRSVAGLRPGGPRVS